MIALELVVILGAMIFACGALSRRTGIAGPILLLLAGLALGFAPALREVHLPPELMLLVFLPMLLYWEALTTSLREIRATFRGIMLTSTLLVVVTAAGVAGTVHALGMAWGPAWVLGAALAPTDATAVGALARSLPRRTVTVLRAAVAAARLRVPFERAALVRLADGIDVVWDDAARDAFVDLLAEGRGAIPVFETLDHVGLLVPLLPEWASVRARPQRNAYHRFTVDRHSLEAVAECVELRVELGHQVISMELKRCLRRAVNPRDTRARTACGVVARRSAASS